MPKCNKCKFYLKYRLAAFQQFYDAYVDAPCGATQAQLLQALRPQEPDVQQIVDLQVEKL